MNMGNNSTAQVRSLVDRIERLEEQKKEFAETINDVYTEAKSNGHDVKALREVIRLRRQDKAKREAHEAAVDNYKNALGMLSDLPLGKSAIERMSAEGLA